MTYRYVDLFCHDLLGIFSKVLYYLYMFYDCVQTFYRYHTALCVTIYNLEYMEGLWDSAAGEADQSYGNRRQPLRMFSEWCQSLFMTHPDLFYILVSNTRSTTNREAFESVVGFSR